MTLLMKNGVLERRREKRAREKERNPTRRMEMQFKVRANESDAYYCSYIVQLLRGVSRGPLLETLHQLQKQMMQRMKQVKVQNYCQRKRRNG